MDTVFFLSVFLFLFFLFFVFCFCFYFLLFLFLFLFSFLFCFLFSSIFIALLQREPPATFFILSYTCQIYMHNDSNQYSFFETYHSWGLWWAYKSAADARPQAKCWQKDRRSKKWTRPSKNKQKTDLTELPKVVSPSMNIKWQNTVMNTVLYMYIILSF